MQSSFVYSIDYMAKKYTFLPNELGTFSITEYVNKLRALAGYCEFGSDMNEMKRDVWRQQLRVEGKNNTKTFH